MPSANTDSEDPNQADLSQHYLLQRCFKVTADDT